MTGETTPTAEALAMMRETTGAVMGMERALRLVRGMELDEIVDTITHLSTAADSPVRGQDLARLMRRMAAVTLLFHEHVKLLRDIAQHEASSDGGA